MDPETLESVGSYSEQLLTDPTFQFISAFFEQTAAAELLATKPHETKLRESIYARVAAHREFLSTLHSFVKQKDEVLAKKAPTDHLDEIDDPAVHNIYEGHID